MKISERLALLKAGYTKEDIAEMIGEETKAPEQGAEPEAEVHPDDHYMDVISSLAQEVRSMKEAMQATNLSNDVVKDVSPLDKASEILASLINQPAEPKQGGK